MVNNQIACLSADRLRRFWRFGINKSNWSNLLAMTLRPLEYLNVIANEAPMAIGEAM